MTFNLKTNMGNWHNPRLAGRIPELDGIRGLAILLVLIWHYIEPNTAIESLVPGSLQEHAMVSLRLTWTGVDLFFVLSGFLIGGILYDAKGSKSYYRTFYCRRVSRIFPIYFLWIAIFVVGLQCIGPNSGSPLRAIFNRDIPVWSYPLFLQNFAMVSHGTWGAQWMAATWSLAVEEQFYLLLPFVVRNLSYRGITWVAVTSIVVAPIVRFVLWRSGNIYFGPYTLLPCRADALAFGVLVALACRNENAWAWLTSHRRYIYASFLLLGCGMVFMLKNTQYNHIAGATWIAAFYTSLLLLNVVEPSQIERTFFRNLILVRLGIVSYAVYIFHEGINDLLHVVILGKDSQINSWPSLYVTLLSLIVVFLFAAASWRFMEKPILRRTHSAFLYAPAREAEAFFRLT